MAENQPLTFEEMQSRISSIEKNQTKIFKAQEEDEKEKEARKAIEDPGDYEHLKSKKHMSQNDDDDKEKEAQNNNKDKPFKEMMARMRRAIQAIAQEEDEDKRNNMAKAAQEMMDENKNKHEAQNDDDKEKEAQNDEDEKKEARIASLERKTKAPIVTSILKVASIINPKEIKSITKDLKTASLEEVESLWNKHYKSFSASLGVKGSESAQQKFVPFQMNAALEGVDDEDNMYIASTPKEYSQLDTEKLMQRATEMYT